MEVNRKPFQGVLNIIRFNWHLYAFSVSVLILLCFFATKLDQPLRFLIHTAIMGIAASTCISLLVSAYVYDMSGLYKFRWLEQFRSDKHTHIVNINAGFDETSALLAARFPDSVLSVFDFYDPEKHTEISIKRARTVYPPYPGTQQITTAYLPLANNSTDKIFVIFAAHEIRNKAEQIAFFKELNRVLRQDGQLIIMEHLRDKANFMAYNIGFLHFHTKSGWHNTFSSAGFHVKNEFKITPFISTFILEKNGITS